MTLGTMTTDTLESFTASQLTNARSLDFARLTWLQAAFADRPDPRWYAFRNFAARFPRSMSVDLVEKAAVAVGTTADATFGGPLALVRPLAEGFIEFVRAASLIGKLGLRRVPMLSVSMPVETTASTGFAWIGEGLPKLLGAEGFATLVVAWAKTAGLIGLSDEVLRMALPGTEAAIRDVLVRGAQLFVDTEFTDQTIAATTTRPGGLANGSPTAAASGTTVAAAQTDIKAAIAAFVLVNPNLEDARFVMSPSIAVALAIATNSTSLLATGGTLYGIPVATTAAIGNKILLFDASQVVYGDDPGGVRIDVSRNAMIQFDSAPSDPNTAADVFLSTWQRGLVAFKAEYPIRWKLARTNAARVITGVAYA